MPSFPPFSNGELTSKPADPERADILDETIDLFRANSLFRNFEIKGPADRILIILILYISDFLAKIGSARTVPTQMMKSAPFAGTTVCPACLAKR